MIASITKTISVAAIGIFLNACASTPSAVPVDGAELQSAIADGKTLAWKTPQGLKGTTEFAAGGVARSNWKFGSAEGHWRVADALLCTQFPKLRGGVENCFSLQRAADSSYLVYDRDGKLVRTYLAGH